MSISPAVIDALVESGCTVEQLAAFVKTMIATEEAKRQKPKRCFVYVMRTASGLIKVGISREPEKRRMALVRDWKVDHEIVHMDEHPTKDAAYHIEQETHRRLRTQRVQGEYFSVDAGVVLETLAKVTAEASA